MDAARSFLLLRFSFAALYLSASNSLLAILTDERQLYRSEACEYFSTYKTHSHVVQVVGFLGGSKFKANVRNLNPSATGPQDNLKVI